MLVNRNFAFWIILERLIRLFSGFCIYLIFAKYLSVDDFGILNLVLAVISILSSFIFFGADQYNLYKIRISDNKFMILSEILFIRFCVFLFASIFIFFFNYKILGNYTYIIIIILFTNIFCIFSQFLQAIGRFVLFSKISIFSLVVGIFFKSYFILNEGDIYLLILAIFIENFIFISILGYFIYNFDNEIVFKKLLNFNFENIFNYIKVCLPLMAASVLVTIYFKIEVILITRMLDFVSAGYWGVLLLTLAPWSMLSSAMSSILNHDLSEFTVKSLDYEVCLNKYIKFYIFISLFGILINFLIIKFFMTRFLGDAYIGSVDISIIASLVILPIFLGSLQDVSIAHRGETKIVLKKLLLGLPISVILFCLSIYFFDLIGGAISLVISYYITSIFSNYFFDKYFFDQTISVIHRG